MRVNDRPICASITVFCLRGQFGFWPLLLAPVVASARTRPDFTNGVVEIMLLNSTWMFPAMRSTSEGAELLYGMWVILVPVMSVNSSPQMCPKPPTPEEP